MSFPSEISWFHLAEKTSNLETLISLNFNSFYSKTFSQFFDFSETLQISVLHSLLKCCFSIEGLSIQSISNKTATTTTTKLFSTAWGDCPQFSCGGWVQWGRGLATGRAPGCAQGKAAPGGGLGCTERGCPELCKGTGGRWGPESESWARSFLSAGIYACRQLCEIQRTGPWHRAVTSQADPIQVLETFTSRGDINPMSTEGGSLAHCLIQETGQSYFWLSLCLWKWKSMMNELWISPNYLLSSCKWTP